MARPARAGAAVERRRGVGIDDGICTDKTRTLTTGDMSVTRCWTVGREYSLPLPDTAPPDHHASVIALLEAAAAASRAVSASAADGRPSPMDDPVDFAIRRAASVLDIPTGEVIDLAPVRRIPFSSERKFAAVFHPSAQGGFTACVKGAPRIVLEMCAATVLDGRTIPLEADDSARLLAENERLAAEGLRVIAVAGGRTRDASVDALRDLVFGGFVGLSDPPAPGVQNAIARLKRAGLRIVMLTGDQRRTAEAIGRQLGVLAPNEGAIDSRDWRALAQDDSGRATRPRSPHSAASAPKTSSRSSPHCRHETRSWPCWAMASMTRRRCARPMSGSRWASGYSTWRERPRPSSSRTTGSTPSPPPSRKAGSSATTSGSSCSISSAATSRRSWSCSSAVCWRCPSPCCHCRFSGPTWSPTRSPPSRSPWNQAMPRSCDDRRGPAPGDPLPPIPRAGAVCYAALILAGTFAAFLWGLGQSQAQASTMAFMTLAFAQILHLGNARSDRPVLRPAAALANRYAVAAVAVAVLLQLLPVWVRPLGDLLHVAPLSGADWLVVAAGSAVAAVVGQSARLWRGRRDYQR